MVTVEIRLLGPPLLVKTGRPLRLHSAKTLALLAFLLLEENAAHSREKLAGLLWGDSPDSRARQSLRQALYSLRRTLGAESFVLEESAVQLALEPGIWVDALEFRALAAGQAKGDDLDALRGAMDLYRGPLLEGREPTGCPVFDEWLFFQRDGLEQRAMDVLQRLVDGLLARGDYRDALRYAQRLLALNPLHEGAHCRLMRAYSALGDRDGVRRQYRLCAELLERELGAEPADETQALYHALETAQTPLVFLPRSPLTQPPDERALTLPFLGREGELATLESQFEQAVQGRGRLVLVSGEAGVGKTRLVQEFLRYRARDAARPMRTLAGQCYAPESGAPYAMWADALQGLERPEWQADLSALPLVWRQQLARLVPVLGPLPSGTERATLDVVEGATPAESRLRLLQGIVQALAHLARARVLCLWFDDLHWADEASLELLHYVARHTAGNSLLLLGTHRPADATGDAGLGRLASSHVAHVIRLATLDRGTVGRMLARLGIAEQADLVHHLYQHSDGNPLFLVEALNTLSESGQLRKQAQGSLSPQPAPPWPVPARIQDLIRSRTASLSAEQRRALAAGAVIGRPFGLYLLRKVSGLSEPQALDAVEQSLRRGFLEERPGVRPPGPAEVRLAFHHGYVQRVVYEGLSAIQRRALHRRAGQALLQLYPSRAQTVIEEVAHHLQRAGDPEAVAYLEQAARQAQELFAYQRAAELCSRALQQLHEHRPDDHERRFGLLLLREALLDRQGRRAEQAADVSELKRLAEAVGDAERQAVAAVREAGFLGYVGRYEDARLAGERALALYRAAGDPAGEGRALRELGFASWAAEDYSAALAYGRAALQLHRRLGDVEGEATALHNLAEVHRSLGSPRQAVSQYETALELYWARQDRRRQGLTLYGLGQALRQAGDLVGASQRYRQALEHCQATGDRLMASRVHHALSGAHWESGEIDRALDQMQQAVDTSREIGYGPGIAHGLIALSDLQAQAGRLGVARKHLQEALAWMRLTEDEVGLGQAQDRLRALERETPLRVALVPTEIGWVKSHVALAEGKVYCAFESPMARCLPPDTSQAS